MLRRFVAACWQEGRSISVLTSRFFLLALQNLNFNQTWLLRFQVLGAAGAVLATIVIILLPTGYFGPLSARIRGLFVRHTRTGNPLVDSVAEHQPASSQAYWQYLHVMCYIAPVGFLQVMLDRNDAKYFLIFFAMVRRPTPAVCQNIPDPVHLTAVSSLTIQGDFRHPTGEI